VHDPYREQVAEWLKEVVASEEFRSAPVKIVFLHMPPSPKGWHGGAEIDRLYTPILNEAGIDVMFSAHIHRYKLWKAGDKATGCNFPILCNPNQTRMDVDVDTKTITCNIYDKEGKLVHTDKFPVH
ncbi:MAG: metallophosphoesterase, partial [Alistipes sp.]|nr:metallophosphoesterase [Alistipes sp.]